MYISEEKVILALKLLVEGNSISSTERITGIDGTTIMKALALAGERCEKLMGGLVVNVPVQDVECDEIWGYVQKKEGHKTPLEENDNSIGDAYCFVAIERNTKLILNFALGRRDTATTQIFIACATRLPRARNSKSLLTASRPTARQSSIRFRIVSADSLNSSRYMASRPMAKRATRPLKWWIRRWSQSLANPIRSVSARQSLSARTSRSA
jgi:hypothetical protein